MQIKSKMPQWQPKSLKTSPNCEINSAIAFETLKLLELSNWFDERQWSVNVTYVN